jgi:hypothetical protein
MSGRPQCRREVRVSGSRASWAVIVAFCAPLGCAWHGPGAPGDLAAPRAGQASLVVRLADLPDRGRRLLQAPAVQLRVSVVDGKGTTLKQEAVAASAGEVRLEGLPLAPRVLVTLVRVDGAGQPVPGSQVRSVGALVAGANALPLSAAASRGMLWLFCVLRRCERWLEAAPAAPAFFAQP